MKQPLQFDVEALKRYPLRSHPGFIEYGGNSNTVCHPAPNGVIGEADEMNARTLPRVRMPNRDGFLGIDAKPPPR